MTTPEKISPNFYYHELFSEGIWSSNHSRFLKRLLDARLLPIMEKIRADLNQPMFVNNWKWGGPRMYRGFRPKTTNVGSNYSQHKFGRAVDFNVNNYSPEEIHQYIFSKEQEFLDIGLTRLEDLRDATSWVHLDLAWTGHSEIVIFRDN